VLTPVPGASPGIIPPDTIIKYVDATLDTLLQAPTTVKGGVLIGIVDVPNAPRFFPGSALFSNPAFKASIDAATGKTVTVLPNCINSTALISSLIVERIKYFDPANPPSNSYPPIISCAPATVPGVPPQAALGDLFVLSPAEQAALSGVVATVNAYLQAKADQIGFAYYDPNNPQTGLPALKVAGILSTLPNFTSETEPFGPGMSLDGVHPRKLVHSLLANSIIAAVNGKYGLSIPPIPIAETARR
jgi:hypothetical protein